MGPPFLFVRRGVFGRDDVSRAQTVAIVARTDGAAMAPL